jgi:hypothetical protein
MKKIIGSIVFITIITSGISFADTYHFELYASGSGLKGRFDVTRDIEQGYLTGGVGGLYMSNHEDYKIADVKFALGNEMLTPGLKCELGFKGLLGEVEEHRKDADLMAIGFLLSGVYEISKTVSPIPIEVSASVCVAPGPLCFLDSERYREIEAGLGFRVIENGAILLGYKYIKVHIEDHHQHWNMSDDSLFLGFRLKF